MKKGIIAAVILAFGLTGGVAFADSDHSTSVSNRNINVNRPVNVNSVKNVNVNRPVNMNSVSVNGGSQTIAPSFNVEEKRDFVNLPSPSNVDLLPFVGDMSYLYTENTLPWTYKKTWERIDVAEMDRCFWGCQTNWQPFQASKERIKTHILTVVDNYQPEEAIGMIVAQAGNPGELWANVAMLALDKGATKIQLKRMALVQKNKASGASFYIGGGLSVVNDGDDKATAGSSGIGFGKAVTEPVEGIKAVFVVY